MGARIKYGNFSPDAKENFAPSATEDRWGTIDQLSKYNLGFSKYANPCELYQTVLDGTATAFPSDISGKNLGLWSVQLSQEDGYFSVPIVLTLIAKGQYISQGLTFSFDTHNNIYCVDMSVEWYRDDDLLLSKRYFPDTSSYYVNDTVENYNKVVITFYKLNMPQNRLKLQSIDYGYGTWFEAINLRNTKLIQEIDPISTEISINTTDFTLDIDTEQDLIFQRKQKLSVEHNGNLISTAFIKDFTRKSKTQWEIKAEDYIGLMDSVNFAGGIYENKSVITLLAEIFNTAKVPFVLGGNSHLDFTQLRLSGYIPYTTCREALMQVAFAIQAVVDTSFSDVVKVYGLGDIVSQKIPKRRVYQGQNFNEQDIVTAVELTSHYYSKSSKTVEVYKTEEGEGGEDIFIKFSEPLYNLTIENGEILESHTNYAIINAYENCVLKGFQYDHFTQTKAKKNPLVTANEIENIITIKDATLVSSNNVDNVLEKCYNYLINTRTIKEKIVEAKHVRGGEIVRYGQAKYGEIKYEGKTPKIVTYDRALKVGELIETETEYLGTLKGRIIKQTFDINSSFIVKDCELR